MLAAGRPQCPQVCKKRYFPADFFARGRAIVLCVGLQAAAGCGDPATYHRCRGTFVAGRARWPATPCLSNDNERALGASSCYRVQISGAVQVLTNDARAPPLGLRALSRRGAALACSYHGLNICDSRPNSVPGVAPWGPAVLLCWRKLPRHPRGAARVAAHELSLLLGSALGLRANLSGSGHRAPDREGRTSSPARCPEAASVLCGFVERRHLAAGCLPRCG